MLSHLHRVAHSQTLCAAVLARVSRGFASASDHASLIKQLRVMSGAPITDVKACLEASNWDLDQAYNGLRQKGLAAAVKKASRHASEGLVGLATTGFQSASIVEVNSETDFVARNELFQGLVMKLAQAALSLPAHPEQEQTQEFEPQKVQSMPTSSGIPASEACAEVAGQVRENVRIRRAFKLETKTGCISTYVHQSLHPGLGRIASLVLLEPEGGQTLQQEALQQVHEVGQELAMHAAGMRPLFLTQASVPEQLVDHERETLRQQAGSSGKPAAVINKMVEGRLGKYFEECVLTEQRFVLDDRLKVKEVVDRLSKAVDLKLKLARFLRVQCGEGLETTGTSDFVEEVSSVAQEHKSA